MYVSINTSSLATGTLEMEERVNREQVPLEDAETSSSLLTNTRCCCFPCFSSGEALGKAWSPSVQAVKKIREWSEIVAGPKWKTFIRRFNRNKGERRHGKFQYDPLSYALNFDEGASDDFDGVTDSGGFGNFSARYASASGKQLLAVEISQSNEKVAAVA